MSGKGEEPTGEIAALLARRDAEGLARLAADPRKDVAKAARRALHALRSRGVATPEAPAPAPAPAPASASAAQAAPDAEPALVSAPDGAGQQAIWLVRGGVLFQARASETAGLLEFGAGEPTRRQLRALREAILAQPELLAADAPPAWARWLIEEAYERTLAARRGVPPGFARARTDLGPLARRFERHPALDAVEPAEDAGDPAELLDAPFARAWLPDRDALERCAMRLQEVAQSRLVVDERQRDEQARATLRREADAWFDAGRRAQWTRRLLDLAYVLHLRGRADEARRARALADRVGEDARIRHHVFTRCFRLDRAPAAPPAPGAGDEPRLILTPGEARRP